MGRVRLRVTVVMTGPVAACQRTHCRAFYSAGMTCLTSSYSRGSFSNNHSRVFPFEYV